MFYSQLKKLCEENGVKITPLVKELGMSTGGIKRWQNGVMPNGETLLKFAEYFNVSIDYLLKGKKNELINKKESEKIMKRYLSDTSKQIGSSALNNCLGHLFENLPFEDNYDRIIDLGVYPDYRAPKEENILAFLQKTGITRKRFDKFVNLIINDGKNCADEDYPILIEFKKIALMSDKIKNPLATEFINILTMEKEIFDSERSYATPSNESEEAENDNNSSSDSNEDGEEFNELNKDDSDKSS